MSLPKTARAAVVAEYGKPIEIRELPVPQEAELEPGALLVRVDVASICGSDVHQWDGMTQALAPASLPIVLGHEMMGTVVAFGPGPREDSIGQPLAEGDRIPLDRINEAIQNMRAFREIKPLVLPWAER